jgi:hypothetical protein
MTEIIYFVLFYLELLIYSLDDHNPLGFFLFKLYKSVSDTTSTLKLRIEGCETCSLTTGVRAPIGLKTNVMLGYLHINKWIELG